jgi:hypothetical protein
LAGKRLFSRSRPRRRKERPAVHLCARNRVPETDASPPTLDAEERHGCTTMPNFGRPGDDYIYGEAVAGTPDPGPRSGLCASWPNRPRRRDPRQQSEPSGFEAVQPGLGGSIAADAAFGDRVWRSRSARRSIKATLTLAGSRILCAAFGQRRRRLGRRQRFVPLAGPI